MVFWKIRPASALYWIKLSARNLKILLTEFRVYILIERQIYVNYFLAVSVSLR